MSHFIDEDLIAAWEKLIEYEVATEAELDLVTSINGYSMKSINDILYARTGFRDLKQFEEANL